MPTCLWGVIFPSGLTRRGTGVRMLAESVSGSSWNRCPDVGGIGVRIVVENAAMRSVNMIGTGGGIIGRRLTRKTLSRRLRPPQADRRCAMVFCICTVPLLAYVPGSQHLCNIYVIDLQHSESRRQAPKRAHRLNFADQSHATGRPQPSPCCATATTWMIAWIMRTSALTSPGPPCLYPEANPAGSAGNQSSGPTGARGTEPDRSNRP